MNETIEKTFEQLATNFEKHMVILDSNYIDKWINICYLYSVFEASITGKPVRILDFWVNGKIICQ